MVQLVFHQHQCEVDATEIGDGDENLKEQMKQMEVRSQRQENEINVLKTNAADDRKIINQLENRVAQLETIITHPSIRSKRPYRLLPASAFVE